MVAHKQRNGFYLFLASNVAFITFGLLKQCYGIVVRDEADQYRAGVADGTEISVPNER